MMKIEFVGESDMVEWRAGQTKKTKKLPPTTSCRKKRCRNFFLKHSIIAKTLLGLKRMFVLIVFLPSMVAYNALHRPLSMITERKAVPIEINPKDKSISNDVYKKIDKFSTLPKNLLLKSYTSRELRGPRTSTKYLDVSSTITGSPNNINLKAPQSPVNPEVISISPSVSQATRPILSGGSRVKQIIRQGGERERELINPNKLKIIGGIAKGKKIESPQVYLRPMMGKVREALFSTLKFMEIFTAANTTRVLDTFCGSGSVGLESLSRGAAYCCFVDLSPDCTKTAMKNLDSCGFSGRGQAICSRAEDVLLNPSRYGLIEPFQLISITPPYEEVVYNDLIDAVCNSPLIEIDTVVVIEYPVEMGSLPFVLGNNKLFGVRNRKYGRTILSVYVNRPSKKYDMRPEEFSDLL